jgi:hypothetical protein
MSSQLRGAKQPGDWLEAGQRLESCEIARKQIAE